MNFEPLLTTVSNRFSEILGDNLVGIYVHGSIAFQCFKWDKSDIDFIVVVNRELSRPAKLCILITLDELRNEAPPKGFEVSVVQLKFCKHFEYPTPYELHFSNGVLKEYLENPTALCKCDIKRDCDLAAHFSVIKHTGIVLYGQPISAVFGDIPREDYVDSICLDIENAMQDVLDNPVYVVLNLCRVYAYLTDNLILSKEQGGHWGLSNLPSRYASIISESVNHYLYTNPLSLDDESRIEFCDYMLNKIYNA